MFDYIVDEFFNSLGIKHNFSKLANGKTNYSPKPTDVKGICTLMFEDWVMLSTGLIAIRGIAQLFCFCFFFLLILICWIAIFLVDSVIHFSKNRGLER